jgi:hypothetical protein
VGHPIRNLADADTVLHPTAANAIHTFQWVFGFYRQQELYNFSVKYVSEQHAAYKNIPKIKVESVSKPARLRSLNLLYTVCFSCQRLGPCPAAAKIRSAISCG